MGDDGKERSRSCYSFQDILRIRAEWRAKWLASLRKGRPGRRTR